MYDSVKGDQFIMVMTDKEVLFNEICCGLYYHDLEDHYLVLVSTIEENREGFFHRELSGAREDSRALEVIGYLSHKTFEIMVRTINNLPVSIEDVRTANTICRCDVPTLKIKAVRRQPKRV